MGLQAGNRDRLGHRNEIRDEYSDNSIGARGQGQEETHSNSSVDANTTPRRDDHQGTNQGVLPLNDARNIINKNVVIQEEMNQVLELGDICTLCGEVHVDNFIFT
jgi:hypothetical protein